MQNTLQDVQHESLQSREMKRLSEKRKGMWTKDVRITLWTRGNGMLSENRQWNYEESRLKLDELPECVPEEGTPDVG